MFTSLTVFVATILTGAAAVPDRSEPSKGVAHPVPFDAVRIEDTFWTARQLANIEGTLRQNFEQCEKTGRLDNLAIAAGRTGPGAPAPGSSSVVVQLRGILPTNLT